MNTKQYITELLYKTEYDGILNLVDYIERDSDFFEAPASANHHCAYVGGLAEHSRNVYDALVRLVETFGTSSITYDTIAVTALLHDVCKTNYYVQEPAWRKDEHGKWESYIRWGVNDQLPLGHGEKSLFIVSRFIQLSDAEAAAIRWHMGAWTEGVTTGYAMGKAYNAAVEKYPLVTLLATADNLAPHLTEKGGHV